MSDKPDRLSNVADIKSVFDHWATKTATGRGRPPVLDTKRKTRIASRLKDRFTVEDLCNAVDGFVRSPFHNGTETGQRYLGIETIFRDAAQVEKGMELAAAPMTPISAASTDDAIRLRSKEAELRAAGLLPPVEVAS